MGMLESLRNLFNPKDEDDMQDFDVDEDITQAKPTALSPKFVNFDDSNIRKMENSYTSKETKVIIYEPREYSEATNIVDSLKSKKIVVVNFANMKESKLDNKSARETQEQIFNFINGAVYAIDGNIRKISSTIFVIAPSSVDIDSNINQEFEKKVNHKWGII